MDIMDIMEMAEWPRTPGRARLRMALDVLEEETPGNVPAPGQALGQTHADAAMLEHYLEILLFSQQAHQVLVEQEVAEQINRGTDLLDIALEGTTDDLIGMVIENEREGGGAECLITSIYRDPGWVGLNPQLELCRGLEAHIFSGGPEEREVQVVLAIPADPGLGGNTGTEPRGELPEAIREVVLWHGATGCFWHE